MVQIDPGGKDPSGEETQPKKSLSYADRAKMNIKFDHRLKRNVLEIDVEKSSRDDEINLDQNCIAKLLRTIGMDLDRHVEGYKG